MTLEEFIRYIKDQGCRVIIYRKKRLFKDQGGDYRGFFGWHSAHGPLIQVAAKERPDEEVAAILCHEFAHFLQWKKGLFTKWNKQYGGGLEEFSDWLDGKNFKKKNIRSILNSILTCEYDAERRGLQIARKLNINIGCETTYIRDANSYMTRIKQTYINRKDVERPPLILCEDKFVSRKRLLSLAPLFKRS